MGRAMIENRWSQRTPIQQADAAARRRRRWRRPPARILLALTLLAGAGGTVIVLTATSYRYATESFTNPTAGYSFRHPPGWNVSAAGSATTAVDPARDVVVTFGRGARGDLLTSSRVLIRTLRSTYRDLAVGGSEAQVVGGRPALLVGGTGTNPAGTALKLLAISVEGDPGPWAIVVFADAGADPARILPVAQEVVGSFRAP